MLLSMYVYLHVTIFDVYLPGGGAVVVAGARTPPWAGALNENPVAAVVAAGAVPNENPDPSAGLLEAPNEKPPVLVDAAPCAVVVGAAGDPKENAPVGLDVPPNPPN